MSTKYYDEDTLELSDELKKMWVEDLRGGPFKQTTYNLQEGDRCCCLGVLGHILIEKFGIPLELICGEFCGDILTDIGLDFSDVLISLSDKGDSIRATSLNDDLELTFGQIATMIEVLPCKFH